MSVNTKLAAQALAPIQPKAARSAKPVETLADKMSVGFGDLLDVVNPLQQLPVVSSVYREATGEHISIPARLAGGFLFGGPAGLIGSAAMTLFEEVTGDSLLGHLKTFAEDLGEDAAPPPAVSAALPWMREEGAAIAPPTPPSAAAMAEALRRKAPVVQADGLAAASPEERPAPQTLAKLYALHATHPLGASVS